MLRVNVTVMVDVFVVDGESRDRDGESEAVGDAEGEREGPIDTVLVGAVVSDRETVSDNDSVSETACDRVCEKVTVWLGDGGSVRVTVRESSPVNVPDGDSTDFDSEMESVADASTVKDADGVCFVSVCVAESDCVKVSVIVLLLRVVVTEAERDCERVRVTVLLLCVAVTEAERDCVKVRVTVLLPLEDVAESENGAVAVLVAELLLDRMLVSDAVSVPDDECETRDVTVSESVGVPTVAEVESDSDTSSVLERDLDFDTVPIVGV